MTYPKVSIIILNFNQIELTLDCLQSLSKVTYPNLEIILVDNHSAEDSSKIFIKKYPRIVFIQSEINLGYAGGNNLGLTRASAKYILVLNNDTKVTPGFLEPLVTDMLRDPSLGIIQSKIFVMDQPKHLDAIASYQTSTGFLYHRGYLDVDKPEYTKFLYSFSAKGACILIRRAVLELGLFDPDYFAYFEETDLCWRAWLQGFAVGFEPQSVIYHKMGATSSRLNNVFINYHSFKNRIRTILKNAQVSTLIWMLPTHLFLCLAIACIFTITGRVSAGFSILRAMWWNIQHFSQTRDLRTTIQSSRVVSDTQIFAQVLKNPSLQFYLHHLSLVRNNLT